MDKRHNRFTSHIAAEDQHIYPVEFPRIQELAPANIRTVNIGSKKETGHGQNPLVGCGLALQPFTIPQMTCLNDDRYYTL
jgi:hypothetical protein